MLLTVLLLGVGVSAVVYNFVTPAKQAIERDQITAMALAQAKEALIGRAASDAILPGSLPCPDWDDGTVNALNTANDGVADVLNGNQCPSYIGRLPWKTLGLPDLRDGSGERLWYALSPNFRDDNSASPLNSDTVGQLTITGTAPANNVIAIIFAPGPVVGAQVRNAANQNNVANYLEGENANGDTTYTIALPTAVFNDKLLPITSDALFNVVNVRVAKAVILALESYRATNNYYPNANLYTNAAYSCDNNTYTGRLPRTMAACGQAAWGALPAWFSTNNWEQVTHYATSKACGKLDLSALGPVDEAATQPILQGACVTFGAFQGLPPPFDTLGATLNGIGIVDAPVTVTSVSNNVRVLVIVTGRSMGAQIHPCTGVGGAAQCMEDTANTDGNTTYAKPSRFPASNDRMALTCGTNSPCAVVP